jgi:hypothetical protein
MAADNLCKYLVVGALMLAACSGDSSEDTPDMDLPDSTKPVITASKWTSGLVEGGNMGLSPKIALAPDGTIGAAWISAVSSPDGLCTELGEDPPPPDAVTWQIRYGTFDGTSWAIEDVATPRYVGQPRGVDLAFDDSSTALIAGQVGAPAVMFRYCGVHDAAVYRRASAGSWTVDTAVTESGEAAVGEPASDFGTVVGNFPALAVASNGDLALAYKDVHGGGLQSDDFRKADLEMAWKRGGGWTPYAVDPTTGGGDYSDMIFDSQDRPVIVQYVPVENSAAANASGVWVHRSVDDGATWQRVQLYNQPTKQGPSIAKDPSSGKIYVAYYQAQKGYPIVASLEDESNFESVANGWKLEDLGDSRYDEGYGTSIAVSGNGTVGLTYYRCTKAIGGLGECNPADDALIFTYFDGFAWTQEVVEDGEAANCGNAPALTFDANNRPIIIYRCEVPNETGIDTQVHYSRRNSAP